MTIKITMKFNFKAKTQAGEYKEGIIEANSKDAAAEILQKNNLFPVNLEAEKQELDWAKIFLKHYERVTVKESMIFFRQLAILIEARVPIVSSLMAISEQTANEYFIKIIREIAGDIEDGMSLSGAMEKHKDVFSGLAVNIIKSGEASGNLKKSVDYVAENIEKNYNLASRIKSALMYPCIVLVVFFLVGFAAVSFIIPRLTQVIKDLNAEIPWYTQIVIFIGDFMASYWWAAGIIILGAVGGVYYYVRSAEGKKEWDQLQLKLPVVGPMLKGIYLARFSENLAVLLTSGVPIIRALNIVSAVMSNIVYENIFLRAAAEVKAGGNMSNTLRKYSEIPPMVSHMVKIGEDSGQIDSVLVHIAKFYDQETERMARNLATLLEPILMVIIGLAVGFMAFAILMPIYGMYSQIQ